MQPKTVWIIALLVVGVMMVVLVFAIGVTKIEINSWAFAIALWSFFLAVVVPVVHLLVSALKGKGIN